ncbi:hypothetical protein D9M71_524300 [compost metagenome]
MELWHRQVFELAREQRGLALFLEAQHQAIAHGHFREDHHLDQAVVEHRRLGRLRLLLLLDLLGADQHFAAIRLLGVGLGNFKAFQGAVVIQRLLSLGLDCAFFVDQQD